MKRLGKLVSVDAFELLEDVEEIGDPVEDVFEEENGADPIFGRRGSLLLRPRDQPGQHRLQLGKLAGGKWGKMGKNQLVWMNFCYGMEWNLFII